MPNAPRIQLKMLLCALALGALSACAGSMDAKTAIGKRAILEEVNLKLSEQKCAEAIALIRPVYDSEYTDNGVRMAMAAAYGCEAKINLFKVMGDIALNSSAFAGGSFWAFLATEFPSTTADRIPEAAQLAQDALLSVIAPGAVVLPNVMFNKLTTNPGSYSVLDRLTDANAYLFFVSMAGIGAYESRYGAPYPNGLKSVDLPWSTPTAVTADGCAFGASVVNFVDSLSGLAKATTGTLSKNIKTLQSTFESGIYAACDSGCTTLCGLTTCPTCPSALRDRTSCTYTATDPSSCAVAGITTFLNTTPAVGWQTGP